MNPVEITNQIGLAISSWELMELEYARLYSVFVDKPGDYETIVRFGDIGATFSIRMNKLEKAAQSYFVKNPSQKDEGDFLDLLDRARKLSDKRQQIAHGICWHFHHMLPDGGHGALIGYAWTSPIYSLGRLTEGYKPFWYAPEQIHSIGRSFTDLKNAVVKYALRLLPPPSPETQLAQ